MILVHRVHHYKQGGKQESLTGATLGDITFMSNGG